MVKTLDVSQQVALERLFPQDSCVFVDDGNMQQKRPHVCDVSHSKHAGKIGFYKVIRDNLTLEYVTTKNG